MSVTVTFRTLAVLAAGFASAGAAAQTAEGLGAPPGDARRGAQVFRQQLCHTCHGTQGQGGDRGSGPKIYPNPFPYVAFAQQTRKPRQAMPPYPEKTLPEQDLVDIYHYLFSTRPSPAAKDIPLLQNF